MNELITIEDHFMISGIGLVVIPLLPLPKDDRDFKPFTDQITIELPDGTEKKFKALFSIESFVKVGGRGGFLNLVIIIKDANKADAPIGSRIFVNDYIINKIK